MTEGTGVAFVVAATFTMVPEDSSGNSEGLAIAAGEQKQRQWQGQTTINQKAAAIAAEMAIVAAVRWQQ